MKTNATLLLIALFGFPALAQNNQTFNPDRFSTQPIEGLSVHKNMVALQSSLDQIQNQLDDFGDQLSRTAQTETRITGASSQQTNIGVTAEADRSAETSTTTSNSGNSDCAEGGIRTSFDLDCFQISWFQPSTRAYFDTGKDELDEVDLFTDGSLNVTLQVVSIAWHTALFNSPDYTWGPVIGAGLSTPGKDAEIPSMPATVINEEEGMIDITELQVAEASNAPVFMGSIGFEIKGVKQGIFAEFGYAVGWSADESFGDISDGAVYVGLKFDL